MRENVLYECDCIQFMKSILCWEKHKNASVYSLPRPVILFGFSIFHLHQMSQLEKEEILAFENHLAAVNITEKNSLLLAQLVHLNPK